MSENSWRNFQSGYILGEKKKSLFCKSKKSIIGMIVFLILIPGIFYFKINTPEKKDILPKAIKKQVQLSKNQLSQIISNTKFNKIDKNIFIEDTPEGKYKITTSIDVYLQQYLLSLMDRLKPLTRGKPQRIALVVMEPDTGKIIAMTGFDLKNPDTNPCMESDYPAASIFKIVTAAAAVETLGYKPNTKLYFNGNKHTLYKRQLKDVKNKYTSKTTFSRAFAESINPIFGKIGKNYLGKEKLDHYAGAFGFNQVIPAEFAFESGTFKSDGNEYHLAELGCGFNTDTTISPIFGAMLISAIVNSGNIILPSIVEHVNGSDGQIIYKNKTTPYKEALQPQTAAIMMKLMERTITKGTAKKSFRGVKRDKVLSKILIGGKTGSLYNKGHTIKYDWFTGFGKEKTTDRKIVLSIVVGHGKYIGTRASAYAKMILKQYFKKTLDATAKL
ncbi:MAG: PbpA [Desulfobacula sp.]|uniref:penicillin-binding transpeptidase domain-containing protein n=1 Tax=Desulfobacula sp. TaxID=2593537 RepID=UPI001ED2F965|nr:PbpA [Desulfobacula sp.]MBT3804115.1 PbpA [Desulfobacula sp.]MBT5971901.1 PbpA [Desulfobacula sp.]